MTYGLTVVNPDGFIKIDNLFSGMVVTKQGVSVADTFFSSPRQTIMQKGSPSAHPLFLGRPPKGQWVSELMNGSCFRILDTGGQGDLSDFEYVCVDTNRAGAIKDGGTFGLQVYSQNGASLVFDSRERHINIDVVVTIPLSTTEYTVTLPTPPIGRRFIQIPGMRATNDVVGGVIYRRFFMVKFVNETTVSLAVKTLSTSSGSGQSWSNLGKPVTWFAGYTL